MPYDEFKKRIDTARNILVGAVPSPAGQIDQITYALMYKFMNDIDDQSAALPGGKRTYFTGDYEKYNWHNLMSPSLGAHERLELYRQAVQGMAKNENLPSLFREIYQNAFLPFNSSHVLTLFLKEIDKFSHSESDDIGDAYEYLLSITGSQGDVGQFRTPRHIIKFIVEAVNPTKDDKVLDPAVGTAGFLIAAYNHVKNAHDCKDENGVKNNEKYLSADELSKLHSNYRGFDIDPTMVRTASVNMYLHGFSTPDIINHDSLSSEEYWNDKYDVILANPPFMTPKGGIQPLKKFTVVASRAEVLFVDYIASHLKPNGRAGIVVPEGVIFQSGNAYKQLRKNLVENYLYAVVSLPAGVFQPYSGVKTSILLLDRELAKRNEILFVKVENDGFSSGAQRRAMSGNQLPEALERIDAFKCGILTHDELAHTVLRSEIAESGDYNLSGDRYKVGIISKYTKYPLVILSDVIDVRDGTHDSPKYIESDGYPLVTSKNLKNGILDFNNVNLISKVDFEKINKRSAVDNGDIIMPMIGTIGGAVRVIKDRDFAIKNVALLKPRSYNADVGYICHLLNSELINNVLLSSATGGTQKFISLGFIRNLKIPLPPIETQRQIVAELDGYQKIIDAAQIIVKSYIPTIKINHEWPVKAIGYVATVISGQSPEGKYYNEEAAGIPFYQGKTEFTDRFIGKPKKWTTSAIKIAEKDDILMSVRAPVGPVNISIGHICIGRGLAAIRAKDEDVISQIYLYEAVRSKELDFKAKSSGSTFESISRSDIESILIPLPPIETQHQIVAKLEAEQQLIDANKKLIEIYQQKIKDKIAEVWGE